MEELCNGKKKRVGFYGPGFEFRHYGAPLALSFLLTMRDYI